MTDQPLTLPHKRWWIFFGKVTTHRWWWYKLIPSYRAGWQHCWACCEAAPNVMVYFDPQMNGMSTSVILGRPTDHIKFVLRKGGHVLYVEMPDWHERMDDVSLRFRRGWTITCASAIAFHMALDTRLQTPKALFDHLVRHHAATEVTREKGKWQCQVAEAAEIDGSKNSRPKPWKMRFLDARNWRRIWRPAVASGRLVEDVGSFGSSVPNSELKSEAKQP